MDKRSGGSLRLSKQGKALIRSDRRWLWRDKGSAGRSRQVEGPMGSRRTWRGGKLSTLVVREDGGAADGPRGDGQKAGVGLTRWDGQANPCLLPMSPGSICRGWPDQMGWAAKEGMVSGADCVDVGWPCKRIYGDFVQLVLGGGQAAVEGLDVWWPFFFFLPRRERVKKHLMLNHCNCF